MLEDYENINMLEDYENKSIKQFIILYYEKLLESAVKREDYEMASKYKKWIDNLKNSGEESDEI